MSSRSRPSPRRPGQDHRDHLTAAFHTIRPALRACVRRDGAGRQDGPRRIRSSPPRTRAAYVTAKTGRRPDEDGRPGDRWVRGSPATASRRVRLDAGGAVDPRRR